ncbi:MAG: FHA domain-containing protein [Anaerolineales bacterium]|jgi:predicted component of type VI protein secretion system
MSSDLQRLVMRSGPTPGKVYELTKDSVTIGREASADIVIPDAEVSRTHARLTSKQGTYMLEDLGSTNGTFVNKQRITGQRMLNPGDEVTLGESVVFSFEGPTVGATVAVSAAKMPVQATIPAEAPPEPPAAAASAAAAPEKKSHTTRNILIGCGCLVILVIVVLAGLLIYIDSNNLYCAWLGLGCPAP